MKSDPFVRRILVLFAHPAFQRSRVQRQLARAVMDLPGITFHDLYEAYPDFDIDVPAEQRLLRHHELIVFQHPLYWYSSPAILKEWQDLVLEHGWAYGRDGKALHGKALMSAISTGGPEQAYRRDGHNRFTIREFLAPFEQTANLCGMDFLPPFVVHGTHRLLEHEILRHSRDYKRVLEALRDGRIDIDKCRERQRINADLDTVVRD